MNINLEMIRAIADEIRPLCGDDDELFFDTLDGETDAADILDALLSDEVRDRGLIDGLRAAELLMKSRRERIEMRQQTARRMLGKVLSATGMKKAERPIATVSIRDGNLLVCITDEWAIPTQLCTVKTITSPDRAAIKAQIEAGETVPGAELVRGDTIITVRVA